MTLSKLKKYDFSKQTHMIKYMMDCEKIVHKILGPEFYVDDVIIDQEKKVLSMEICKKVEVVTLEIPRSKEE